MPQKIKVLFLSSELTPIAKVGGLGDVTGALPKALKKNGLDIRILIPYYEVIEQQKLPIKKIYSHLVVPYGDKDYIANIYYYHIPNSQVPVYLIHHHEFLSTGPVYAGGKERFMFFSQAINEFLKLKIFQPDIIHINDWHPVNIIHLVKKDRGNKQRKYKTLLTIHNLAMQGKIKRELTNLWHPSLFNVSRKKKFNSLELGIINSNYVNTVSREYAKEILTKQYSSKLTATLNKHRKKITGIVNGIDYELFNPAIDKYLYKKYNLKTIADKRKNKLFLQRKCRLPVNADIPILGLVSRLTKQKGIDLLIKKFDSLAKLNAQFIFTGKGKRYIEKALIKLQKKYPHKFYFLNKFDISFGQQIYGGADFFLMPSLFEPCGLGQMIAMSYGTIPIVRATGGLKDTVKNNITGFVFTNYNAAELFKTIKKALETYQDKIILRQMMGRIMKQDFSWHNSAKQYIGLYKKILKK